MNFFRKTIITEKQTKNGNAQFSLIIELNKLYKRTSEIRTDPQGVVEGGGRVQSKYSIISTLNQSRLGGHKTHL